MENELGKLAKVPTPPGGNCPQKGPRYELVVSASTKSTIFYDCAGLGIRPIEYVNASLQPLYTVVDGILMPGG